MNEILHANVFFVVASIATVIFCILISLVLYQALKIFQKIRIIVDRIESASEQVAEDVSDLRTFMKGGGMMSRLFGFIMSSRFAGASRRSRRARDDEE